MALWRVFYARTKAHADNISNTANVNDSMRCGRPPLKSTAPLLYSSSVVYIAWAPRRRNLLTFWWCCTGGALTAPNGPRNIASGTDVRCVLKARSFGAKTHVREKYAHTVRLSAVEGRFFASNKLLVDPDGLNEVKYEFWCVIF